VGGLICLFFKGMGLFKGGREIMARNDMNFPLANFLSGAQVDSPDH
jgi:hypothetical protein